jgi:hypothetical protein
MVLLCSNLQKRWIEARPRQDEPDAHDFPLRKGAFEKRVKRCERPRDKKGWRPFRF